MLFLPWPAGLKEGFPKKGTVASYAKLHEELQGIGMDVVIRNRKRERTTYNAYEVGKAPPSQQ